MYTEDQVRQKQEEVAKHYAVKQKAIEYYDSGYWASGEHPGKLMPYGTWDTIDVSMEIWYFFQGIAFGCGDKSKRESN